MRLWNRELWPYLCNRHLGALWNEMLIAYRTLIYNRDSWSHHPEVKQFENCPEQLFYFILDLQEFRLSKHLQANLPHDLYLVVKGGTYTPYKTTQQQIKDLIEKQVTKPCKCDVEEMLSGGDYHEQRNP